MPLIYITGIPGSGKSTVRHELIKRGYEAHDTDEGDFREWRVIGTGKFLYGLRSKLKWSEADLDFKKTHDLGLRPEKVAELEQKASGNLIFLCGAVPNVKDVWSFFVKIFCLTIDNKTLKQRISERTSNDFGKTPEELADILRWNETSEKDYRHFGATIIDATQPVDKVVDEILSYVEEG